VQGFSLRYICAQPFADAVSWIGRPRWVNASMTSCLSKSSLTHRASRSESGQAGHLAAYVVMPSSIHVTVVGIVAGFFVFVAVGPLVAAHGSVRPVLVQPAPECRYAPRRPRRPRHPPH